jgi:hypothetical protein
MYRPESDILLHKVAPLMPTVGELGKLFEGGSEVGEHALRSLDAVEAI